MGIMTEIDIKDNSTEEQIILHSALIKNSLLKVP